ncbi:MAG: hypothetical protein KDB27_11715 [Planctomycetales bacterium]|nr:hypothetical protein [Planctomycetales bacterium]
MCEAEERSQASDDVEFDVVPGRLSDRSLEAIAQLLLELDARRSDSKDDRKETSPP